MKLYQAGYYRLGGHGSGAGWKLVAPSAGMSEIAKAGFRGIAAKLVDLRQPLQPAEALGIFGHDRFYYLMHVNYAASGEDSRGVAYVHGYCFHQAEYYELAKQPEMLFGVLPESFDPQYHPEISAYPVVQALPYRNMNERRLLDQYAVSREMYRNMLLGAICALEGYSGALCIKCTVQQEQYVQAYQDVLYLIMKGLPYHLRQKLLSFSAPGIQTMVYLSDTVAGSHYIDLDTGSCQCDTGRLASYQFTRLYNMDFFYNSRDTREQIFQAIAAFADDAFADPLKRAGCALVEAGFQKSIKKNDGGIEPELAVGLMRDFLSMDLQYGEETAGYLAALLEPLNQNGLQITDWPLSAKLDEAYAACMQQAASRAVLAGDAAQPEGAHALTEQMALLYAYRILSQQREKGFEMLQKMQHTHADGLYPSVCRYLEQIDARFFADYYWNRFLPGALTTLKKAELFLNDHGEFSSETELYAVQKLLKTLARREMKGAESFEELSAVAEVVERLSRSIPYLGQDGQLLDETYFALWNSFDMGWFDTGQAERYEQYGVHRLAGGLGNRACPNAQKVSSLLAVYHKAASCSDVQQLWELLFEGGAKPPEEQRQMRSIQRELQKDFFQKMQNSDIAGQNAFMSGQNASVSELDRSLVLYYEADKKQFDLVKWIRQWAQHQTMDGFTRLFTAYVQESRLLAEKKHRECLVRSLEETVKSRKQSAYARLADDQKKALQSFYRVFLESGRQKNAVQRLVYTMHREVLGAFALLSLAFCEICLHRYGSQDTRLPVVLLAFAGVCLAAVLAVKTVLVLKREKIRKDIQSEAPDSQEEGGVLASCIVVMLFVSMVSAAAAAYFLDGFLVKAGCIMGFMALAALMAVLNGLVTKGS